MDDRSIVITGFMGTGKSTVSQQVAAQLHRPLIDMDALIVKRAEKPIAQIFAHAGEQAFREMERSLAEELAIQRGLVIATGGGTLVNAQTRDLMVSSSFVVCLHAAPEVIEQRLRENHERPLALNWRDLLHARREAYAAIPFQVDTVGKTPSQIAKEIIALWRQSAV
jgi:shikimate kinase